MVNSDTTKHKIILVKKITEDVFILRMERNKLKFKAGQHINVGPENSGYTREYSIYSGENDPYIEILIKEIPDGFISPKLCKMKAGEYVQVEAPFGYFQLPENLKEEKFLFVATGTGIAPYNSFIKSFTMLDYTIIHGIPKRSQALYNNYYNKEKYIICTSQEQNNLPNSFNGRVTKWIKNHPLNDYTKFYLCGNRNMINDSFEILKDKNIPPENILVEAYF